MAQEAVEGKRAHLGTVYGVGVGPGDPELVTVKAAKILRRVDAVVAPVAKEGEGSLALATARPFLTPSCQLVEAELPMVKDKEVLDAAWQEAAALIAKEARAGRNVAFVTLGDCMFYSTWPYVARALGRIAPEIRVKSVPGVTAMSACAAEAQWVLAQGSEPLLVWVGRPELQELDGVARVPNMVFMKSGRYLADIERLARELGRSVLAVRRVGHASFDITQDLGSWTEKPDYLTTVFLGSPSNLLFPRPGDGVETDGERSGQEA